MFQILRHDFNDGQAFEQYFFDIKDMHKEFVRQSVEELPLESLDKHPARRSRRPGDLPGDLGTHLGIHLRTYLGCLHLEHYT